ncbi:hypothetical protein [Vibrio sp. ABG19]|uniref:hypothetical protein n=1 Tax=Vibrio sp. ABG19 TaxID=2817385 RepID=UPI00249E7379|nr:hypothetical protein [Vibrio sp. ABG19]WGY46645.1 hypothetical protein J0X00_17745 [Vibrio sp. ABG19]
MFKLVLKSLALSLSLIFNVSFAEEVHAVNRQVYSDTLLQTRQKLLIQMGNSDSDIKQDNDMIGFPIFDGALMVLYKPYGMNFDDTLTLPYALFITESPIEDVAEFYQQELSYYTAIKSDDNIVLLERYLQNGNYPQDYYRIPHVKIRMQTLNNGEPGTLFSITYPN